MKVKVADFKNVKKVFKKDPVMHKLAHEHGELDWERSEDPFYDLIYSIVSQQLSDKAASTIFERFLDNFQDKELTPVNVLKMDVSDIKKSGISGSKASYILNLTEAVHSKKIVFSELREMGSEDVIEKLTEIKGIGRWTAEMFLIFTLDSQDVFSVGDLGLRKAVSINYGVRRDDRDKILEISVNWKPYRSWASRYLWKSLDK